MGQQLANSDRLRVSRWNVEIKVGRHIVIKLNQPLLNQLQHGDCGKRFASRTNMKHTALSIHWNALGEVGKAVPLQVDRTAILHDSDNSPSDIMLTQVVWDLRVEVPGEAVGIGRWG